jgi:hypothetical protein
LMATLARVFTLKDAGATAFAIARAPDDETVVAKRISGIVTNQPSVP